MKHMNHGHSASKKKQPGTQKQTKGTTARTVNPKKDIPAPQPETVPKADVPFGETTVTEGESRQASSILQEQSTSMTENPDAELPVNHCETEVVLFFHGEAPEEMPPVEQTEGKDSLAGAVEDLFLVTPEKEIVADHRASEHASDDLPNTEQVASGNFGSQGSTDSTISPMPDQLSRHGATTPVSAGNESTVENPILPEESRYSNACDNQDHDGQGSADVPQPEIPSPISILTPPDQEPDYHATTATTERPQLPSGDPEPVRLSANQDIDEVIEAILAKPHIPLRIPLDLIDFYSKNRLLIKQEELEELAKNIALVGIINDVLLRPKPNGRYEVVAGEKRTRASRIAGMTDIPAKIYELTDMEARQIRVAENLHRENYHPMEEALAIGEMKEDYPTPELIARRLSKPISYVIGRIRLLSLVPEAQEILLADVIRPRDALELAAYSHDMQQTFIDKNLSGWKKQGTKYTDLRWAFDRLKFSLKNPPFNMKDPNLVPEMGICSLCEFNSGCQQSLFADLAADPVCRKGTCYKAKSDKQLVKNLTDAVKKHKPMAIVTADVLSDEQRTLIKEIPGTEGLEFVLEKTVFEVKKPQPPNIDKFKDGKGNLNKKFFQEATFHYNEAVAYQDAAIRNRKIFRSILIKQDGKADFFMFTRDSKAGPTGQSGKVGLVQADIKAGTVTIKQLEDELARIKDNEKSAAKKDDAALAEIVYASVAAGLEAKEATVTYHPLDTSIVRWMLFDELHHTGQREFGEHHFGEGWSKLTPEKLLMALQNLTDDQAALLSRKAFIQIAETKQANSVGGYILSQLAQATGIDLPSLRQETDQKAEERTKKFKKVETELLRKIRQKQKKVAGKPAKTTSKQD